MRLLHYSRQPLDLRPISYVQDALNNPGKPNGLWVSVEGEDDWASWCATDAPAFLGKAVNEITLKPDANILKITTLEEFDAFHREYAVVSDLYQKIGINKKEPAWARVQKDYQGIVIAPYQWARRLHHPTQWYYGWDCASGCIWDTSVIALVSWLRPGEKDAG